MHIWLIDYGYTGLILSAFIILTLYSSYSGKNKSEKTKFFYALTSLIVFCTIVSILYILRSYQIEHIEKKCFDYPVLIYKKDIPLECYNFKPENYKGIGWPVRLIFWAFLYIVFEVFLIITSGFPKKFPKK